MFLFLTGLTPTPSPAPVEIYQKLSPGNVEQITNDTSKFDFIKDIPGILEGLVSDIVRLINTLPGWLSALIFVVIGIMLFAIALKVVAFVLDAIPFL